jgi:septum formation protein
MTIKPSQPELRLILASGSPRRRQFLHELGLSFSVLAADIDETPLPGEHPGAMTCRLAEEKARAVAARLAGTADPILIIASDTTVALGDEIYGKPLDADDAKRMLRDLRGGPHQVFSAVSVLEVPSADAARDGAPQRQSTRINTTDVFMRDYHDAEIDAYVASGDPLDKAGAYGIQARDFHCVEHMQGCYASVMGLPLADLAELLEEFGCRIAASVPAVCGLFNPYPCCAPTPAHSVTVELPQ